MKTTKLFVVGLSAFIASAVQAQYTYQTNSDNTLTITSYTGTSGGAITLPSSAYGLPVTGIAENAFYEAMMTSVTIPSSITKLGEPPFGDCIFLNSISVDSANPSFSSVGGILFNKNQTRLIQYPPHKSGTSYVVPAGVTALGADAFASSDYLKSISIPEGVTEIGSGAFFFMDLTTITIPASVNYIGDYAFEDDANLVSVYFDGNAPGCGGPFAFKVHSQGKTTAYYLAGTSGWTDEFSDSGPYLNILEVLAQGGVNVSMVPAINFTSSATQGTVPLAVQFTSPSVDSLGNTITHWSWSFGDGSSSTEQNPSHTYVTAGLYPIFVEEINRSGLIMAGAVGSIAVSPIYSQFYAFTNGADGAAPSWGLTLAGNTLYGTAQFGGVEGYGTLFRINTDGTQFSVLYNFTNGSDGAYPQSGLAFSGGTLYGTASQGGTNQTGAIFAFSLSDSSFTVLHNFGPGGGLSYFSTNSGGFQPAGQLALSGSSLFGTTVFGGTFGYGTVFEINTDGTGFTSLHSFTYDGDDGGEPEAGLTASGGNLYGTTFAGGSGGSGTVFSIGLNGFTLTALYSFTNGVDGGNPVAGVAASGAALYGTTDSTIFRLDGSGFTTLYTFTNGADGANPTGGLVLAGSTLYGTDQGLPEDGGVFTNETVFEIQTNGQGFAPIFKFNFAEGHLLDSALSVEGQTLYGSASSGGAAGAGTIFNLALSAASPAQGSLKVSITPASAVLAGAQWQVDGGSLQASGVMVNDLTVGTHNVSFTSVDGLNTPGDVIVNILSNHTTLVAGTYTPQNGSLQVTLTPSSAANAGAQWRADGGAYHKSGVVISNLVAISNHSVSFKPVAGFRTPANLTVSISNNLTTQATGTYIETNPPILAIVSPDASQRVSNGVFTVTGTVRDNVAVDSVQVQLNNSGWMVAGSTNSFANWTENVNLSPGANILQTYATDSSANYSHTNTVQFVFVPSAVLNIQTNGNGSITPVDNGKLLAIGTNYTLTASPAKNWLFSNWVASGGENFVSNNPVLKFTMQSNLVLTANFVTNLFVAAQGAYHGLFAPTGVLREQTNSGAFTLNLLSTGSFSGDLFLGSNTVSLAGEFDISGHVQTNSPVKGGKPLTTILQLDVANQAVSGTVSDGSFVAQLDGDQNVFGPSHPATDYAGQYTWTIPGTNNTLVGPNGTSYGTITVSADGDITFTGNLADGTAVSQSSAVSKGGRWPMYFPSSNPNESLFGWNYFTNQTLTAPALVSWVNVTNKAKSGLYPSGFTNQQAAIVASYYNPTAKPLLSVTEAQVTLEGGGLPFVITNQINLEANNAISVPATAGNTNKLKLTITPKTGLITGSFQNPANARQTITVNGVLLQNQTNAAGYFLATNQSGAFLVQKP